MRVKRSITARKKRRKILKLAKDILGHEVVCTL